MHTVFALLCFVVVIHWLIFPYPSGLLHWHCGNLTIAPVPAKQPWWIWINTSCEFILNDCITTTKQSTTKPCAYFLGYTVWAIFNITILQTSQYRVPHLYTVSDFFHSHVHIENRCKWQNNKTLIYVFPPAHDNTFIRAKNQTVAKLYLKFYWHCWSDVRGSFLYKQFFFLFV